MFWKKKNKFKIKPYLKGNELFESDTYEICKGSVDGMYDDETVRDSWEKEEFKLLKRKLRKQIKKQGFSDDKLKRMAILNVKKNFLAEKEGMIEQAYRTSIRRKYGDKRI